jgi:DNA polymerase I-like protein with 3'-5' exonuclease and polymerase domains
VFINADYSQAEARVVAHPAREPALIELFNDPERDVQTENAARIFSEDIGSVTFERRYLAKRVIHASNYGMGADKLESVVNEDAAATGVRITKAEAEDLISRYHMLYPGIRNNFWREVETELRYSRCLNTPFGRKRQFFGRWGHKFLNEAYSYIPQSTIGDLCCKALVRVSREIPEAEILLNVHDSILVQCESGNMVRRIIPRLEQAMTIPFEVHGNPVHIPVDFAVGHNWGKFNPEENPRGLQKWDSESSFLSNHTPKDASVGG